jgi:hypothetical protein
LKECEDMLASNPKVSNKDWNSDNKSYSMIYTFNFEGKI